VRSPSGRQSLYSASPALQSGTPVDGTWQLSLTVPAHAEPGRWTINGLSLSDQMSNYRSVSFDDLAAAGLANSFEQTGSGDTSSPVVQSLTFTPDPVDTSAGGQTVTVRARFTDDRAGVSYAYLEMAPPSGGPPRSLSLGRISGDGTDGVWEGRLLLPRFSQAGTWRVNTLRVWDAVANTAVLTAADLRAAGVTHSFTQTGTADTSGPVLAGLTWTPGAVDTSGAARTVTVRARLTDDLSGLPASSYGPNMTVQSPSGAQTVYAYFSRVSGSTLDATYEAALTVPRYSEAGAWTVKDLVVVDQAGNNRRLAAADITAAGFEAGFSQTGAADTDAPTLVSVSAAPAEVDTTSGPATVMVNARITDAQSGLSMYQSSVTFRSPSGGQTLKGYIGNPLSGTTRDGRYQITVTVPRYAEPGLWRLSGVELVDQVGNKAVLGSAELAAAGLGASFEQTGATGDSRAPVLADFTVNPDAVNVATSAQRVTVRARVTDDLAGVNSNVGVFFTSPSGNQTISPSYNEWIRISGTVRDGVYETTVIVPFRAEAGAWSVKVTMSDAAGNSAELSGAALTGLGFTSSLAVAADVAPSAPAAPWGVTASAGNAAATVTWNAPADDGGSPVTGYRVTARSGGVTVKAITVDPPATSVEIDGLTNGTTYTFTVTAINAIGSGAESAPSNATTPATVPGAPTAVTGSSWLGTVNLGWQAPASDGGTPIVSYVVSVRSGGSEVTTVTVAAPATGTVVEGLTNGTPYTFTVTAVNAMGSGPESQPSEPVTPVDRPGAPTGVTATPGNGSATVSWTPGDDGGSPIISYTVQTFLGTTVAQEVTVDAPATSVVVDGLSNGAAYTFSVSARNSVWGSWWSAQSAPVTPATTPDAPTSVVASARDASAVVRWTAPADDGGSALTGYTITVYSGDAVVKTVTAGKSATQVTVGGLENGITYRFTVAASNAVGTGPASSLSAEVTPTAPPPSSSTTTTTSTTTTSTTTTTAPAPTTTPTTTATAPPVTVGPASTRSGYWMVSAEGRVYAFGEAPHLGEPKTRLGNATAVDLEPTKSGNGYWVLDDAGRVFPYGDARWLGNLNPTRLAAGERATSLSRTVSGNGYWIFTNRGRVLTFGDAVSYGDVAAVPLNGPVLDSIVTPSGKGYYMVASDGGIFAFGDAKFHGSMGGTKLNAPVQSLVPDNDGEGYWLVAADGGIFAFKAPFRGSMGAHRLNRPVSGMVPFGDGYLMVGEDGGIFNFSDRPFLGSLGATPPARPVVAVAVLDA
jgi:titin